MILFPTISGTCTDERGTFELVSLCPTSFNGETHFWKRYHDGTIVQHTLRLQGSNGNLSGRGRYVASNDVDRFFKNSGEFSWGLNYDVAQLTPAFSNKKETYIFTKFGGKFIKTYTLINNKIR